MVPRVDAVVEILKGARRSGQVLDQLPTEAAPQSISEAYAVQDAIIAAQGSEVVAWKVGATATLIQQLLGVDGPVAGPVFAPTIFGSPAEVSAASFHHRQIECEFAFVLGRDFTPRSDGYSRAEVEEAVAAVVPAVELISPRFARLMGLPPAWLIADCVMNAGLVLGQPYANWRSLDLKAHEVVLQVDGNEVARGTGANVLSDPIEALLWLVNHLSERGIALRAGCPVSTGTMTGLTPLEIGQTAAADYGVLGQVSVRYR